MGKSFWILGIAAVVFATTLSFVVQQSHADQIELTRRDTPAGVQVITVDDQTGQRLETLNGTPVAPHAANEREVAAADRVARVDATERARATVTAALAAIEARPSINPDTARLEQAYIALAEALGIE